MLQIGHWSEQRDRLRLSAPIIATATATLGLALSPALARAEASNSRAAKSTLVNLAQLKPHFTVDKSLRKMLPASIRKSGVIKAATSTGLPPINFPGTAANSVKGLNPDLMSAVSQLLGVKFRSAIYPSTASQLLALQSGRIQLTASTNGDTQAREATFTFIDTMLSSNVLLVKKGNPDGVSNALSLCGKPVGEVSGSVPLSPAIGSDCTSAGQQQPALQLFNDIPSMNLALIAGRITSYMGSDFTVPWDRAQGVPVQAVHLPVSTAGSIVLGWTVLRSQKGLANAIVGALKKLASTGYYSKAFRRWDLSNQEIAPAINVGFKGTAFSD